ncbi:dTMP kinase [bacterium]|nr:dTMP kinase [bacterium]
MKKRTIISFEGIDGCGKTTQAKLLYQYLQNNGFESSFFFEPGGTILGNKIRCLLLDKEDKQLCMWSELFLYFASRAQLLNEVVSKELDKGHIVILDRYIDSTTAYQGYGRGISVELIERIHSAFIQNLFPDLTFLIDSPPEDLTSILAKKEKDRIEQEPGDFQKRVREGYLQIAGKEKERIKVVKRQNIEKTHSEIIKIVGNFLNENR